MIDAQTKASLALSRANLGGAIRKKTDSIYENLRNVVSGVYATIDFPDEDLSSLSEDEIRAGVQNAINALESLQRSYKTGHAVCEGVRTVIFGKPNTGKSTILNLLAEQERAIVTDIAGTTRDVISETVAAGNVTLRLFDTAGVHGTDDFVERIGVQKSMEALENAELILAVFDGSVAPAEEDRALAESLLHTDATVIAIINKSDLGIAEQEFYTSHFSHTVTLSAKDGEGIEALSALVESCFINGELDTKKDTVLTNARQKGAALSALEAIKRAREGLAYGLPVELCCSDCEAAMQAIAELDGRAVSEDIVSHIFSHFCVGK